jgi:iron(III) transport system substrate-binding protein
MILKLSTLPAAAAMLASALFMASPTMAQDVDPNLAASWTFMQQAMPGVSYDVLKAACAEGSLLVYHGTWVEAQDAQIDGFSKHFPCLTVQKFSATMGELRERFLSEERAKHPTADIYQDSDIGTLNNLAKEGLLANYKISNDAAFADDVKSSGYWYSMRVALVGVAWNTDLVSPKDAAILSDWKGLLDPRWKGRGVVVDPSGGGVDFLPWYVWDKVYGDDFIAGIGKQAPRVVSGINTAAASLASGDVAIIFNASETGLLPLYNKGAPIEWSLPSPGVGPLTAQAIPANAPHPNAAKLYQEYSFTEEGYSLWQKLGGAGTRTGLVDQRPVAAESWYKAPAQLYSYDPADATKATAGIIAKFNQYVHAAK